MSSSYGATVVQTAAPPLPASKDSTVSATTTTNTTTNTTSWTQKVWAFVQEQEFLLLVMASVALARLNPTLGPRFLYPQLTATWLAVLLIFLSVGLTLKTSELRKAFLNLPFNIFVQSFNFFVVSGIVYSVSRGLEGLHVLNASLADGMVVCASLPMAINMVVVLTKASSGDEAAAVFNATCANLIGVFLSPALIPLYLGVSGNADLLTVFYKLTLKVVLPVVVGQLLQLVPAVYEFVKQHKTAFKLAPQYSLIFILYTVFCRTFLDGSDASLSDICLMMVFQLMLLSTVLGLSWMALGLLFPGEPKLRVMGLFGCTFKTVSLGVPLIGAIYEDNPAVGLYTLPLLIWHPMQLIVGSMLAPHLAAFVRREEARLGIVDEDAVEHVHNGGSETTRLLAGPSTNA
jgi:solute carrier family 10 (sodium/bile acid cotransporter), member 7